MKVLITGASGFVGSSLARHLLAAGLQVRGTYRQHSNALLPGVEWCKLSQHDSSAAVAEVVAGCSVVIHLAALAHQAGRAGEGRWTEFRQVNAEFTGALAAAARAAGVRRFVFMSSVAAICSHSRQCVNERTPAAPVSDYGRSKLEGERLLERELRESTTDWCILRPPLVYGPGNPGNMARLLQLLESGWPLPFGSIRNCRSFIFIDNLVDAVAAAVSYGAPIRAAFMLGDGSDFSTPELVGALAAASGSTLRLWSVPLWVLRSLAMTGDLLQRICGVSVGINSYAIDRLTGSLPVDGGLFGTTFNWRPPVAPLEAVRLTGRTAVASRSSP